MAGTKREDVREEDVTGLKYFDKKVGTPAPFTVSKETPNVVIVPIRLYHPAYAPVPFIVPNIGGNKYRLVVKINYPTHNVFVRAVLTHDEYDKGKWKADYASA